MNSDRTYESRTFVHPLRRFWRALRTKRERFIAWRRFATPTGYRARDYWQARYARFGFELRGSDDPAISEEAYRRMLHARGDLILDLCRKSDVHFPSARVLDAGCGAGSYAGILRAAGVRTYSGVDIVPTLFDGLRDRYPGFQFRAIDIGERLLEGEYDLILFLDVAQHIVVEQRFSFALRNLKLALAPDGILLISTLLGPYHRRSFYCVVRPLEAFTRHFPGWNVEGPLPHEGHSLIVLRRIDGR